jgi:hypothetical protein
MERSGRLPVLVARSDDKTDQSRLGVTQEIVEGAPAIEEASAALVVAEALSEAARRAVLWIPADGQKRGLDEDRTPAKPPLGVLRLLQKGQIADAWPGSNERAWRLTAFGAEVRAALMAGSEARALGKRASFIVVGNGPAMGGDSPELPAVGSVWLAKDGRRMRIDRWTRPTFYPADNYWARMTVLNRAPGQRGKTDMGLAKFGTFLTQEVAP